MRQSFRQLILVALALTVGLAPLFSNAQSARVDELRTQINDRSQQIAALEKEIAQYQQNLAVTNKQASSLSNEIRILDTERKKIEAEIKITENRIAQTNLNIKKLELEIGGKDTVISEHQSTLRASLRKLRDADSRSLVEIMLAEETFSEFITNQDRYQNLQRGINIRIEELRQVKEELGGKKADTEAEKQKLVSLNLKLADQKKVADQNKRDKDRLLADTKGQEANYQKLIREKQLAKEAFERELRNIESELQYTLDPKSIPSVGKGVLKWPLDNVRITQYFGNTDFAKSGAYNGNGHNGIDFGAPVGTPIRSSLTGTVTATGNTDVGACSSYGKWILIKHPNGLSTLYAHLSVISVAKGQSVQTSQVIGYSGNTGYSTGPHLHFSVFASDGVSVMDFKTWYAQNNKPATSACAKAGVSIPVAAYNAYLNPMDYLPN